MKAFVIDIAKCNGCYNCQIVCKDEHCGNDWSPYAKPQPDTGQFWCKIDEKVRGSVPLTRISYVPVLCSHCDDAPCAKAAPDAVSKREDGLVLINPEKAQGNKALVDACPYGAIYWNEELSLPQKCTGCAHLLDNGWTVPRCVDACSTGAMQFGDEKNFAEEIAAATTLADGAHGPRVYYLNYPKRFIGGTVVDYVVDEVVIGADVELSNEAGSVVASQKTNEFGDFIFKQVEASAYTVRIAADGYETESADTDATEVDVNLGYIALEKRG